jgi:hypothetical protein
MINLQDSPSAFLCTIPASVCGRRVQIKGARAVEAELRAVLEIRSGISGYQEVRLCTIRVKNMNAQKTPQNVLEDLRVKMRLAALWASFMFLTIYVDYFHLYMPGKIRDLLAGKVFVFDITQVFLLTSLTLVTIPVLMISLSVALSAKVNRRTNIIVAAVYIPVTLFNLAGEAWMHMVFGAVVEVVLLLLIIRYAWEWPRIETRKTL